MENAWDKNVWLICSMRDNEQGGEVSNTTHQNLFARVLHAFALQIFMESCQIHLCTEAFEGKSHACLPIVMRPRRCLWKGLEILAAKTNQAITSRRQRILGSSAK